MDILAQLKSHRLFASFSESELAEIVKDGTSVVYEAGEACIQKEDAGEIFGVLISGRLEATRGAGEGSAHVGFVEAGECFGEMSLLTGHATGTNLTAVRHSEAIVFLQEAIGPVLARNPEAIHFLTGLITFRLLVAAPAAPTPQPKAKRYSLGASTRMHVLAVSCRMNDLHCSYFDTTVTRQMATACVTGLGSAEGVLVCDGPKGRAESRLPNPTLESALAAVLEALTAKDAGLLGAVTDLTAIGHRVVHGGTRFDGPTLVDDDVEAAIHDLAVIAPLDNEYNLRGIRACRKLAPSVPQVAVFDTSFHLKTPAASHVYALPAELTSDGSIRRFGFHGISHEGVARTASTFLGVNFDSLRMISCHLGNGASMAAIDHGRSIDSTMGFAPLDGLVMATRSGDLDPGLILHLIADRKVDPVALRQQLHTQSGLLGLSGVSGDVLTVMKAAEQGDARALLALQVYCQRGRKYLGAYIALLGGVDVIVFTGGVGAQAPGIRARFCQGLEWLGIQLSEERNRAAVAAPGTVVEISEIHSRTKILAIGSDEERTIARHTVRAIANRRVTDVIRSRSSRIPVGISAHHVHLSQAHVEALFGPGHALTWHMDLTQPGQCACKEQVNLIGPKGRIDRVRVLGPIRKESQVEIARTEEFKLGIDAPVRMSGDLDGSPGITLEGPCGQVKIDRGVICAMRHIHMSPQEAMQFAVRNGDKVRVRIPGDRSLIFGDVAVRVDTAFRLDMHIDTDEANAGEIGPNAFGFLDSIQDRSTP